MIDDPRPLAPPAVPALEANLAITVGSRGNTFTVEAELSLAQGVLVLFGPTGAGKSLTLQALAGLLAPVRGFVRIGGETLFDAERRISVAAHRRRVGYVPQHHTLFPFLDVAGNVAFGLPRAERRKGNPRVAALLDELGLTRLASVPVASLSGGERQRVALARALAVEPRLLLLDEPFASIDLEGRAALRSVLRAAIDRHRTPAVLVTHDTEEAVALGDRLVRFERGRTTVAGDPAVVLGRGETVIVTGDPTGPARSVSDGRAEITLSGVKVEGPTALFAAAEAPLRLDLQLRFRAPGR